MKNKYFIFALLIFIFVQFELKLLRLLPKFMHLPHEPFDSLSIHTIRPVTSFLEMGANDHGTCLKVVLHIIMGYTRADENRDPDRLGNLCYTNSSRTWVWEHLSAACIKYKNMLFLHCNEDSGRLWLILHLTASPVQWIRTKGGNRHKSKLGSRAVAD